MASYHRSIHRLEHYIHDGVSDLCNYAELLRDQLCEVDDLLNEFDMTLLDGLPEHEADSIRDFLENVRSAVERGLEE
jgi:hypothetical protein